MINIEEHRKYIYKLMKKAMIPFEEMEDAYQGFCVFYYASSVQHDEAYTMGA